MEHTPGRRHPVWATRQFRWLAFIFIVAAAGVIVILFKFLPSLEPRKLDLPRDAGPPAAILTPDDLARAEKAPHGDLLAGVRDGTPANEADPVYLDLVRGLRDVEAEDLAKQAVRIDYDLFSTHASALRGRVVRVIALIIDDVAAVPLVLDEGTVDWVYRTHLLDPSGNEGYVVDVLEKPEGLSHRDLVLVNAVFVKMATYEGKETEEGQPRIITAPLIMGRALVPVEEHGALEAWDERMTYVAGAIAAILLLGMTLVAYLSARARRGPAPHRVLPPRPVPAGARTAPGPRFVPGQPAAPPPAPGGEGPPGKPAARRPPFLRRRAGPGGLAPRRRSPLLHIAVLGLLLAGAAAYMVFLRPRTGDLDPAAAARLAHEKVLEIESKVGSRGDPLGPEDLRSIRTSLRALIAGSEDLEARLRALEKEGKWASDESKALAVRVREVRLWILDASDVADAVKAGSDPAPAGVFIPHRLALERLEAAEMELRDLAGGSREADRGKLAALEAAFEEARDALASLAARVREGLGSEDLTPAQLPFLGTLEADRERAAQGSRRVEALLARLPG